MHTREEYTVWVWNKERGKYQCLMSHRETYDLAIAMHDLHEKEWGHIHTHLDYSKFQIKKRTVTYSDFEILYG